MSDTVNGEGYRTRHELKQAAKKAQWLRGEVEPGTEIAPSRDVRLWLTDLELATECVRRERNRVRKQVQGYRDRHAAGNPVQHGSWDRAAAQLVALNSLYERLESNELQLRRQFVDRLRERAS